MHMQLLEKKMLTQHAKEWSKLDPNPTTSQYVQNLITKVEQNKNEDTPSQQELQNMFNVPRIQFGTAGLRARMQPGLCGMNDLIVIQTAQGLAKYVEQHNKTSSSTPLKAVVGYDHRSCTKFNLSSEQFAIYTKLVFEKAGIQCILLDGFVATPILAYAVTNINAVLGIMVTASHNPKQDNGYKIYWNDGCQIRPPIDEDIARTIAKEENLLPWIDYGDKLHQLKQNAGGEGVGECCYGLSDPVQTRLIEDAYYQSIKSSGLVTAGLDYNNNTAANDATSSRPKFAYTAMHGVGTRFAKQSFETFNLPPFHAVPSQENPDATFPTVPFPNPEEKGALDEAIQFANTIECDIVLANDPDADRLGVAEYDRRGKKWVVFTGDQIATLLGYWLWETMGKNSDKVSLLKWYYVLLELHLTYSNNLSYIHPQPVAICASTVSSKMLAAIGKVEGFLFEETLTGFKWIGSRALALQNEGYRVILGYEEAIGFSCGGIIPDKDGISALGVIATMSTALYARGESLIMRLQALHYQYGEFVSNNGYYRCNDNAIVKKIMENMRNDGKYLDWVGIYEVESIRDLGSPGYDSTKEDNKPTLPTSISSPMITFRFTNGCVAQFRASGTEPKFKYYIEMRGQRGEKKEEVERRLRDMSVIILEELLHPAENGLILPSSL